jgi:peroxiredoxin
MLGEEPQARAALKKMFRLDPVSGHTLKALIYYEYEVYAQQMEGEGPREVDALVRDVIAAHPQSDLARKKLLPLMAGKTLPISAIEAVADAWIEKEPDNPMPYYILARALFDRGMRLDEADRAMHTSIQLILNGKFIEFGDTSGYRKRTFLPSAYYWSGEIAMARGNKVKALAAAYASQNVASEDDPRAYDLAGRLWEALPGFERAQQAYLRGLSRGSKQAADRLGAIYARKHGQDAGFEQWLDSVRSEGNGADPDRQPAPLFSARDMNGQTVALTELRGKVVVLNFWAVTCAPCRVEMPALNKLAEEYGDRDVVFLAPTGDGSDSVRRFLKKQKFAYRVLPAAGELMVLYGIRGFPVHMVIDKKGRVATRLFGGSKDRHEDLKPYIEAELKAE